MSDKSALTQLFNLTVGSSHQHPETSRNTDTGATGTDAVWIAGIIIALFVAIVWIMF
jgi:hypothetical protein